MAPERNKEKNDESYQQEIDKLEQESAQAPKQSVDNFRELWSQVVQKEKGEGGGSRGGKVGAKGGTKKGASHTKDNPRLEAGGDAEQNGSGGGGRRRGGEGAKKEGSGK